jgi:YHS domain-containing protein
MGRAQSLLMGDGEEVAEGGVSIDPSLEERPRLLSRDPVCGTEVDATSGSYGMDYRGVWYCFCSLTCKRQFEDDPPRYVG